MHAARFRAIASVIGFLLIATPAVNGSPNLWHLDQIHSDAARCLESIGFDRTDAGPDSCVVAYAHLALDGSKAMVLRPPSPMYQNQSIPLGAGDDSVSFVLPPVSWLGETSMPVFLGEDRRFMEDVPIPFRFHFKEDLDSNSIPGGPSCLTLQVQVVEERSRDERILSTAQYSGPSRNESSTADLLDCPMDPAFTEEDGIWRLDGELPPVWPTIPWKHTLHLRFEATRTDLLGDEVGADDVLMFLGPDHVNHAALPLEDLVDLRYLGATWKDDTLYTNVLVKSPVSFQPPAWHRSVMRLIDPDGDVVKHFAIRPESEVFDLRPSSEWVYGEASLQSGELPDGTYRLEAVAWNHQHTAWADHEIPLLIEDGGRNLTVYSSVTGTRTHDLGPPVRVGCDCAPDAPPSEISDGHGLGELPGPSSGLVLVSVLVGFLLLGTQRVRRGSG